MSTKLTDSIILKDAFTIAQDEVKYLGVNIRKYSQNFNAQNYKILKKEIKQHLNKWRYNMFMFGRLNIIKMSLASKVIYRFMAISIKIPARFFCQYR